MLTVVRAWRGCTALTEAGKRARVRTTARVPQEHRVLAPRFAFWPLMHHASRYRAAVRAYKRADCVL